MRTTSLGQVCRVVTVVGTTVPTLTLKLTLVTGSTFTLLNARVTSVRCSDVTLILVELDVLPVVLPASFDGRDAEVLLFVFAAPPVALLFVPLVEVRFWSLDVPAELLPDAALPEDGLALPDAALSEVVPDDPDAALPEVEPEVLPEAPPVAPEDPLIEPPDAPPLGAMVVAPPDEAPPDPEAPPLVWATAAKVRDRDAAATVANKDLRIEKSPSIRGPGEARNGQLT
jgi:hypothetical protein